MTMKKLSIILFLMIAIINNAETQSNTNKKHYLQDAYKRVINDKSTESWILFFNFFPSTFEEFDSIFGCRDNQFDSITGYRIMQEGPLYYMYDQYIYLFFEAQNHIERSVYYNKLIEIAKDGRWDTDAAELFQSCIVKLVINNTINSQKNSFLETLSTYSENDISNFWRFYFDALYPDCFGEKYIKTVSVLQEYERLLLIMEKRYKTICKKHNR